MLVEPSMLTPSAHGNDLSFGRRIGRYLAAVLLLALLLTVACSPQSSRQQSSGGESSRNSPATNPGTQTRGALPLIEGTAEIGGPRFSAVIVTRDLGVGPNRVVFALVDRQGMPVRPKEAEVRALYLDPQENTASVRAEAVARFQQWPVGNQGVLTTRLTLDKPGFWQLTIRATDADGSAIEAVGAFEVKGNSDTPAVGQPAPRSLTPTLETVDDLATITSANPPDPDLYKISVDQALDSGMPLVLVFSTPAFCVSATCGPQVDVISQVKTKYQGQANFIHVEIFEDPHLIEGGRPAGGTVAAVEEWDLPSEPWTFIIDAEGLVRAKFEQFTTADEIEAALLDIL